MQLGDEYYFLGMVVKRPRRHVLVQGFPKPASMPGNIMEVSILEPTSKEAVCITSHKLFLSILSEHGVDPGSIPFTLHTYRGRSFESLHQVVVTQSSVGNEFIPTRQKPFPKRQTQLPFGLRLKDRKKRVAKKKSDKPQPGPRVKKQKTDSGDLVSAKDLESLATGHKLEEEQNLADSGTHMAPSSSSASPVLSTGSCESDSDGSSSEGLAEVVHQEPAAAREARLIKEVERSHSSLMRSRGQSHGQKAPEESEPEVVQAAASGQQTGRGGATYCNATLGLVDVGTQVHHRLARCRHCDQLIQKGSTRFQFAFSRQKFAAWLHAGCTAPHLRKVGAKIEAELRFLEAQKCKAGVSQDVKAAIEQLERDLKQS